MLIRFRQTGLWTPPNGITQVLALCIGGGGGAMYCTGAQGSQTPGGGGGGGASAYKLMAVTSGTMYTVTVGLGGAGGVASPIMPPFPGNTSSFYGDAYSAVAVGGGQATGSNGGLGGAAGSCQGDQAYAGGNGATATGVLGCGGGGGGGGSGAGGNANGTTGGDGGAAGYLGTIGGDGGWPGQALGGASFPALRPGGGGPSSSDANNPNGGDGANGIVFLIFTWPDFPGGFPRPGTLLPLPGITDPLPISHLPRVGPRIGTTWGPYVNPSFSGYD